jgi:hypothetical protein
MSPWEAFGKSPSDGWIMPHRRRGCLLTRVTGFVVLATLLALLWSPSTFGATSSEGSIRLTTPIGCLSPRAPVTTYVPSWVLRQGGVIDYNPEDAGLLQLTSTLGLRLARRAQVTIGHGFAITTVREFHSSTCVVDWDLVLSSEGGNIVFVRVLQLHRPLNEMSFPLLGTTESPERLADGTEVLRSFGKGRSSVTVVCVTDDGLLVLMQVLAPSAPNPTGYPTTTMSTIPLPEATSALTLSQATADALSISKTVAALP